MSLEVKQDVFLIKEVWVNTESSLTLNRFFPNLATESAIIAANVGWITGNHYSSDYKAKI